MYIKFYWRNNMKKIISIVFVLLMICAVTTLTVSADAGPTPQLVFELTPAESDYYAALLYDKDEYPYVQFSGGFATNVYMMQDEQEMYEKLNAYEDADGYALADEIWYVQNTVKNGEVFSPPAKYKLLVYSPDNDRYSVFESDGRYAIYMRYTVTLSADGEIDMVGYAAAAAMVDDYMQGLEIVLFTVISLIVTILVELLIGLCFRFTKGRQILTIIVMNIITLPLMTGLIYIINPPVYGTIFSFPYAFFEIGVTVIEAVVYCILLPHYAKEGRKTPMWLVAVYTVIANLATYAIAAFVPYLPAMILMTFV